jgi:membrane dipeptidase
MSRLLLLILPVLAASACTQGVATEDHLERARALMREVPLIDGHNDLPWELRTVYGGSFDSLDIATSQPDVMTDIPRLEAGLVGGQFWSTYTPSDAAQPARMGMEQVDVVHRGRTHDRELSRPAPGVLSRGRQVHDAHAFRQHGVG